MYIQYFIFLFILYSLIWMEKKNTQKCSVYMERDIKVSSMEIRF